MTKWLLGCAFITSLFGGIAGAHAQCTVPNTFSAGTTALSAQVNANFSALTGCAVPASGGTLTNGTLSGTTTLPGSGAITSAGSIGIGTTSPDTLLTVGSATPSGNVAHFQNSTGSCYINPTSTSLSCSSDWRLKKNIAPLAGDALSGILALDPVRYNWSKEAAIATAHSGFIAQDVEKIFPDLVSHEPDGHLALNYAGLTPYLTKAIQQQQAEIVELRVRLRQLKAVNDDLRSQLTKIAHPQARMSARLSSFSTAR